MGNSQGKNQYVIPWGRIILTITIPIIIILVVAAPAIVMFTAIVKDYSPVVKPALILMLLLLFDLL